MKLTHYGWWMFCPVKLGGLDTEAPLIVPRWWWLSPVYWLAEQAQAVTIGLLSLFHDDYEPMFWFRVTGEIKE